MTVSSSTSRPGAPAIGSTLLAGLLCLLPGCPSSKPRACPDSAAWRPDAKVTSRTRPCPAEAPAPPGLPQTRPRHRVVEFWIAKRQKASRPLGTKTVEAHNLRIRKLKTDGWPSGRFDLLTLRIPNNRIQHRLRRRAQKMQEAVREGKRVLPDGSSASALAASLIEGLGKLRAADELRLVLRATPLRCFPSDDPVYEKAWDEAFDLLQCSQLRLGEPVKVLARGARYWYVWSSYAEGWVDPAALTPPLKPARARQYLHPKKSVVVLADAVPLWADPGQRAPVGTVRLGLRLPLLGERKGWIKVAAPTASGVGVGWLRERGVSRGHPPLSQEALLRRAFSLLGSTYGWGGTGGTRDCSRFMMDVFQSFGVLLPRNSWHQSSAGTTQVDVSEMDEATKARTMEQYASRGVVLLYLPGHIMLYLGRDGGHLYALHQFSGYLVPCKGGGETMRRVNRAAVTSLDLGRGSTRRAFIERITKLVVFQ